MVNLLVIGLVLLSAVFHAIRNYFTKSSNDKQIFIWWYEFFGSLLLLPIFIYFLANSQMPTTIGILIGILSGLLHAVYWIFHGKAYETGDLSHVYPIMRSAPAFVLLFAVVFLQEKVTFVGVIGILLTVLGLYLISVKSISIKDLLGPIKSIFKERASQFALLTMVSVTIYSIIDKIGVGHVHPILFTFFFTFFGFTIFTPYILFIRKKKAIIDEWYNHKKRILINSILATSGYALILVAFSIERVSYVVGVRQLSVVIAVLLGGYLLKEKNKLIRIVASCFIFLGVFVISIAK
jgi:uncharacterized membrane protein